MIKFIPALLLSIGLARPVLPTADVLVMLDSRCKVNNDTLRVHLDQESRLFINSELQTEITCSDVDPFFKPNRFIELSVHKKTIFRNYLRLYDRIKDCHRKGLDQKSSDIFGKKFTALENEEQNKIWQMMPFNIIEQLPGISE